MKTIIIGGSIFILILFFALIVTFIGEIARAARNKKKRANYGLRTEMKEKQIDAESLEPKERNLSDERHAIFIANLRNPVI